MTALKNAPAPECGTSAQTSDEKALFEEARRRQRRRWAIQAVIAAVLIAGVVVAAVLLTGSAHGATGAKSQPRSQTAVGTSGVALKQAGPLSVAPDGSLYVADVGSDRVLMRRADGRFRIIAGDGQAGFSGDGGPAVKAQLSDISDLAFAPNGNLYIADGGRVRVVNRAGVIHTVAGDGQGPSQPMVIGGTPALKAALGSDRLIPDRGTPLSIAFSTAGQLYIATGSQILRLTTTNKLDVVHNRITSGLLRGQPLNSLGPIAIDRDGNIDVGGLTQGWSIWQIAPGGAAHEVGYARGSGGTSAVVQRAPSGAVYGELGASIIRVQSHRLVRAFAFAQKVRGEYFTTTYFAFGSNGTVYADDEPSDEGANPHQQLVKVSGRYVTLLWQEKNKTSRPEG